MCDWIIEKMPWCVEHIGRLPLAGQIILAFAFLAALLLGWYGVCSVASMEYVRPEKKPHVQFNGLSRERWRSLSDKEEYQDWMDAEVFYGENT